ncbi:AMP-binding protein [Methylocystis bryophila]|uniref:Long-chain-fatty-acid--CoA ligase n=1 Tax=Methylocystis bryophila TaxID=655015 RepID=A0A1W6MS81_9HYPH|nr:AMP-binding protein [Methylocystis bryophila]ARN80349.1 long-chain-fatty-acid--CoA ligase [Methylocystis bryophila]BDV40336.1 long-chain-fatty-acid--CoA ligase [Methylocystis bryophila]
MERFWLKSYPPGVPADVDVDAYTSIGAMFDRSVEKYSQKAAFVHMGTTLSYAELDDLSKAFGAFLQGELKLETGVRIALMMPNILQYPIALLGALRSGYTVVNCSILYTARELEWQLADSGAEAIVVLENFASIVQQVLPKTSIKHVITTQLGDLLGFAKGIAVNFLVKHIKRLVPAWRIAHAISFSTALRKGAKQQGRAIAVAPNDVALLQYTGGTTGTPKGATLTHRNIIANLQQHHAQCRSRLQEGQDIVLTAIPLFHIYALTVSCLLGLKIGATNVLVTDPRDVKGLIGELRRRPFTVFPGVNALFKALVNCSDLAKLDLSSLRLVAVGGAPLEEKVARKWKAITGSTIIEAYGLTEASPVVTCNPMENAEFNGSCGLPIPSTEIAIRDEAGVDLPIGQAGELCVRGPQIMRGYWNRPSETAAAMTADGFFRTGDIATIDECGFVRIVDRKKDMINVSGLKVYPGEVEAVAMMHPDVVEAGVVGVPDERSGEAVKIVVVARDPSLKTADVMAHCRMRLAAFKVPRHVEFRRELPKTPLGKILRRALREGAPK